MTSPPDPDLEKRIANIEAALASMQVSLQVSLDSLSRSRSAPLPPVAPHPRNAGQAQPVARPSASRAHPPRVDPNPPAWFAERSPEWWLGGLGIVFLIVALFLLYRYAVDHNWITPLIRVLTGVVVGAGLVAAGARLTVNKPAESDDSVVGLREILLGGGIAVWYISSYAAAIYYQLISIPSARVCFLALSVAAAWLALKERRLVFARIAVGVGFAAPFILPSPPQAVIGLYLYVAALGAVGLVLYLMRGWQSILWLTFLGFWSGLPVYRFGDLRWFPSTGLSVERVVVTLLLVGFGVAFTRVPIMRRRLLAIGSDLYAPSSTSDVPAAWVITLVTPLLTLGLLSWTWPQVATEFWGTAAVAFGIEAFRLSRVANQPDSGAAHIEATAAVLWTLAGSLWVVASLNPRYVSVGPLFLSVAALHAALAIRLVPRPDFTVARGMAKITGLISLATVVTYELTHV